MPSSSDLTRVMEMRNGSSSEGGWEVRMRRDSFGYFLPDDFYEALLEKLVFPGIRWLDVGCGRYLLPHNHSLARTLASRCALLYGVDPDPTIEENGLVHCRSRESIESFDSEHRFDLATVRMVAEHIQRPKACVENLAKLIQHGGRVVVYTVNKHSPTCAAARVVPFSMHHMVKNWLWGSAEKDTFPVVYRMNTRGSLSSLMRQCGFKEVLFCSLADCRLFMRFPVLHWLELSAWKVCQRFGGSYPENVFVAVYERRCKETMLGHPRETALCDPCLTPSGTHSTHVTVHHSGKRTFHRPSKPRLVSFSKNDAQSCPPDRRPALDR